MKNITSNPVSFDHLMPISFHVLFLTGPGAVKFHSSSPVETSAKKKIPLKYKATPFPPSPSAPKRYHACKYYKCLRFVIWELRQIVTHSIVMYGSFL